MRKYPKLSLILIPHCTSPITGTFTALSVLASAIVLGRAGPLSLRDTSAMGEAGATSTENLVFPFISPFCPFIQVIPVIGSIMCSAAPGGEGAGNPLSAVALGPGGCGGDGDDDPTAN